MAKSKEELLEKLSECVLEMEEEEVVDVAEEYIAAGYPAFDGIMDGLVDGMNKASDLYDEEEYFVFFFVRMLCMLGWKCCVHTFLKVHKAEKNRRR